MFDNGCIHGNDNGEFHVTDGKVVNDYKPELVLGRVNSMMKEEVVFLSYVGNLGNVSEDCGRKIWDVRK